MTSALAAATRDLDWRSRLLSGYLRKWVVLGVLIGAVAGVGAIVFFHAIDLSTMLFLDGLAGHEPPVPHGEGTTRILPIDRRWVLPFVVVLGGLLSGLVVFMLAPEAEGHGTDAAIEAFHQRGGRIRGRIPFVKTVASAITIGSGGSAGREGPTAQIAAGFGSWLGDIFHLTPQDRRIAVAVGVGAGIGAIFKAPLGGAILSAEILYIRDFELEALVPGFIASVVGYSIFAAVEGWDPVFGTGVGLQFRDPETLVWYAVLGVIAGVVGIGYTRFFYGVRDAFAKLRIPPHIKPAVGGLGVGLIALAFPEVLSMGYGWLQLAIDGNTTELAVRTMLILVALKIVATALSIGSGGSGGVFAPGLFIGGMVGSSMWWLLHDYVPWMPDVPAPFVIVGMMALFGGVAKAPIAVILMVAEMTNEFSMIVPAMMATTIAYIIVGDTRIYENQMPTRADSPAHRGEYAIPLVQAVSVDEAMGRAVDTARPDEPVHEVERRMAERGRRGVPVIEDGRLVGMFTVTDALRAEREGIERVAHAMSTDLYVAYPSDNLHTALQRMTRNRVSRLPVVERERPDRLLGILSLRDLAAALDLQVGALASARRPAPMATEDPLRRILVSDAMTRNYEVVPATASLTRVANLLAGSNSHVALVQDGEDLTGIVTLRDLEEAAANAPERSVGEVATLEVVVARPNQTVAEAFAQPGAEGLRQLPVVEDTSEGKTRPVGLLRRTDVLASYLRSRDRQARIAQRARTLVAEHSGDVVRLEIEIGPSDPVVGKTLAELRLPPQAVVTALVRDGSIIVPRGQVRLEHGDRVQVLASRSVQAGVQERFRGKR